MTVPEDEGSRRRDAVLATIAAVGVCVAAVTVAGDPTGVWATVARPSAFGVGLAAALLLELGFARFPRLGRALWRRRVVRLAGTGVVGGLLPAIAVFVPTVATPVLATVAGGLVGYAVLFVVITSGLVPDPATWFDRV